MAFHAPIFTKLTNAQQHYCVQMSYNEFYPNGAVSMESVNIYVPYVKHGLHCAKFHKVIIIQTFLLTSYIPNFI